MKDKLDCGVSVSVLSALAEGHRMGLFQTKMKQAVVAWVWHPVYCQVLSIERKDKKGLGIPGGKVEIGETINEAIIRELQEEVGLILNNCYIAYRGLCSDYDVFGYVCCSEDIDLISPEGLVLKWVTPEELIKQSHPFLTDYNKRFWNRIIKTPMPSL